jgi:hypothetical protein
VSRKFPVVYKNLCSAIWGEDVRIEWQLAAWSPLPNFEVWRQVEQLAESEISHYDLQRNKPRINATVNKLTVFSKQYVPCRNTTKKYSTFRHGSLSESFSNLNINITLLYKYILCVENSCHRSKAAQIIQATFHLRGCIQTFPDWVDNEIYAYNNKHSLRSNAKGYGGKTY